MKFAAIKKLIACVAAGLLGQAAFCSDILLVPRLAPPPLPQALWAAFTNATNGRAIPRIWTNTLTLNPRWQTNSPLQATTNYTALACEDNYGNFVWSGGQWAIPVTAITRRHVYFRGHSTAGTNGQFMAPYTYNQLPVHFLGPDNTVYAIGVAAVKKGGTAIDPISGSAMDYNVGILSNDLPAAISPMLMVDPVAIQAKVNRPLVFWQRFNPLLGTCQHNQVGTINSWDYNPHNFYAGGDSGSPDFYILNGALVMTSGRTTSGWSTNMQADCDQLTTWAGLNPANYQIPLLDVKQFPDF